MVAFKKIDLEIPFSSLLSKTKSLNITIEEPHIIFSEEFFDSKKNKVKTDLPFKVNKVNIKKGSLEFKGKKVSFNLEDFDLLSFNRGEELAFKLSSPHLRVIFPVGKGDVKLEGSVKSEFVKSRDTIKINKLLWETENLILNGNGGINSNGYTSLRVFWEGNPKAIMEPLLKKLSPSGFMNGSVNYIRNDKKVIFVAGKFSGNSFFSGGEEFRYLSGNIRWNNRTKKIRAGIKFQWNDIITNLRLDSKKKETNLELSDISTGKMLKAIKIYSDIPIGGIIKNGSIKIEGRKLTGDFNLSKGKEEENEYNIDGKMHITYNTKTKDVSFFSSGLKSEFGKNISISGESIPSKKSLNIMLKAEVNALEGINPYTKKYAGLNLKDWHLKEGSGDVTVRYNRTGKTIDIKSAFNFSKFISNGVLIRRMWGSLKGSNNIINGLFYVKGKKINGKIKLLKNNKGLDIDINNLQGESSEILRIIDVGLKVRGKMEGDFNYHNELNSKYPVVNGSFSGKKISFYDFPFSNVKGSLLYTDEVRIKNLKFRYHEGEGQAEIGINFKKQHFDIEGTVNDLKLSDMQKGFSGLCDMKFSGAGKFDVDYINIDYDMENINYYEDRPFTVKGNAKVYTDFTSFKLKTEGDIESGEIHSPYFLNLNFKNDIYNGNFNIKANDINLIVPWKNNSGSVNISGEIESDSESNIHYRGFADVKGDFLSFPGFPHSLDDFEGSILFKDFDFTLRSLRGNIGGGDVLGNGNVRFNNGELENLLLTISGRNMEIYPMERTRFKLNADLNLRKSGERFIIDGDLNFLSALWEREVDEGISFYTGSSLSASNSKFLDNLEFNLRMTGKGDINIHNSFFTGRCNVDLKLTGDKNFPVLFGNIESNNGIIHVSSRNFDLRKAKIVFNNPILINPSVNIEAETFIKNYRIRFLLNGLSSDLRPEFFSSPPMPTQDIIALISLGELFQRPSSTNISSEVGTTGLVTTALTEKIQERVKKLFGIDILKLDPDPTRSSLEGTSRLTIGKSITKDFLVVYSTDISRATRDIYFFQYSVTPSISLIGKRNEDGRLSLDIRFRKRY